MFVGPTNVGKIVEDILPPDTGYKHYLFLILRRFRERVNIFLGSGAKLKKLHFKVKFCHWNPLTIWHNLPIARFFPSKITPP